MILPCQPRENSIIRALLLDAKTFECIFSLSSDSGEPAEVTSRGSAILFAFLADWHGIHIVENPLGATASAHSENIACGPLSKFVSGACSQRPQ